MIWDERYSDKFRSYGTAPNDFLVEMAELIPAGSALCLAEGEGRNAVFLALRGHDVSAVDLSEVGLKNAEELAASKGVSIATQVADLTTFDPGQGGKRWDAIISIWAHMPAPDRARLHRACVEALAPGGVFLLEAYTPAQLNSPGRGGPPNAALMMTPEALREELQGLEIVRCEELERDVQEGEYHVGLSTTVQCFAIKREP